MRVAKSPLRKFVLSWDPGGTTGMAMVDQAGEILRTEALSPTACIALAKKMAVRRASTKLDTQFWVVIEQEPDHHTHSPLTHGVAVQLRELFPDALRVTPSRWKGHPAAKCPEKTDTKHENDAVRLARWFLATQGADSAEEEERSGRSKVSGR